jgi:hypothetical protein
MQPGGCDEGYLKCAMPSHYPDSEADGHVGSQHNEFLRGASCFRC